MSLNLAADAVVAALSAISLGEPFTVSRAYYPVRDRDQLTTLTLTVMPRGIQRSTIGRGGLEQVDYLVDVGVQKKLDGPDDDAAVAAMALAVESVSGQVSAREYAGGLTAVETTIDSLMSEEHMTAMRVYTGVVSVRLRSWAQ